MKHPGFKFAGRFVRSWIVVFFWVEGIGVAWSQTGTAGLAFLKLGVAGRGVSMAGATTASTDGAAATFYNPAGIAPQESVATTQFLFTHKEWIQDTRLEFLGASVGLGEDDALGVSVNTATIPDIEIRTEPGPSEGTFTSRDLAVGISYGRRITENLRAGATVKYLYEKILIDYAAGYAFDFGGQYETPIERLSLGLLFANIGSMSGFRSKTMQLPSSAHFGPAYTVPLEGPHSAITVAVDVARLFPEKRTLLSVGGECVFADIIAARAGYEFGSDTRGLGTGLGLRYGRFTLDYAYAPIAEDLGNTHTITIALSI